ncbi:cryptochrome/photolyase family protein [Jiulongibacter sediminis]|uniref:Deoxyribodipyrimidine photolyase n=1 Tax=Jiulongibacter sediminis TaxID=1605367 RepID=A0A0P7C5B4_9BACT|nr:deoxyribodipyrimidine photo-lyase [Jiulongibacter sediminis]KPM49520.1 deoxyribodipyrimidine photolyase [Jiulongibacter sediminis]TBX26563.1 deoxyribodipyrimidine photolyase [Jiulongibacter sediminis]
MKLNIFWFRRDLRLFDNTALIEALKQGNPVLCLFIFDEKILKELPSNDARVTFIHQQLEKINQKLSDHNSSLLVKHGEPEKVWSELIEEYEIEAVYTNKDYEPYARRRDGAIRDILKEREIDFHRFKDQVIFEEKEVVKDDGDPYTVYTPYKNKWLSQFKKKDFSVQELPRRPNFHEFEVDFPSLKDIGFEKSEIEVRDYDLSDLDKYDSVRNFPAKDATSYLSPHLRFGTVSIRDIISKLGKEEQKFMNELIWREFFMQILYNYPSVVKNNFRSKYDGIKWRNNEDDFKKWCNGETGYAMVDAGMRELNATGYMHNRVRMVVASFLCKHLLIDWKWGEAYFAEKLLDYELSSNNGNWQWAAGTGCDAAPYFRIFNPMTQIDKFDKQHKYIKKWVPEFGTDKYVNPMVDHKEARERALEAYKQGIES